VRVFNVRGECLAGAVVTDAMTRGVLQLQTGAWYDPDKPGEIGALDRHGNPNMLTLDKGTSKLAQGPISQTTLVEVERWEKPLPPIGAYDRPAMAGG
jgi:biotin/methionine sulfoxide reductase